MPHRGFLVRHVLYLGFRKPCMNIAFLLSRFPYPLDKGDKLRAYHQIKHLSKTHTISLICLSEQEVPQAHIDHLNQFCKEIRIYPIRKPDILLGLFWALFSGLPFQVGYFFRNKLKKSIWVDLDNFAPDAIFCQLVRMSEYVKNYKHPNKVLDYMDVFSSDMRRRQNVSAGPSKWVFAMESKRIEKYEETIFPSFQKHSIISTQDRELLPILNKSRIEVIPNGTDVDIAFSSPIDKKYDILFFGNLSYTPNVESAVFLAQKVVPVLVKKHPNLKVLIAGATPHKRVLALANTNIEVKGWVDDKWACFASAKVFAAPMLINVGMQNKILEAMAVKTPSVATTLANNAIGAKPGSEIIVADNAEDFVAAINNLINNQQLAAEIAANAYTFVSANYSWQATTKQLEEYLLK